MRETARAWSGVFILGTGLSLGSGTGLLELKGVEGWNYFADDQLVHVFEIGK